MNNERLGNLASAMIAFVSVMGAIVACLATVGSSKASDKDIDGLTSYVKAEQAVVINNVNAYEHMRAYALYYRNLELASMLYDDATNAKTDAEKNALLDQKNELTGVAAELADRFFPAAYLNKDRLYNVQKELDSAWAEEVQTEGDLDPTVHFKKADDLRWKSVYLTASLIIFSFSFLFFTLGEVIENRSRILFILLGFGALVIGAFTALMIGVPL